jgi:hypothetical protein
MEAVVTCFADIIVMLGTSWDDCTICRCCTSWCTSWHGSTMTALVHIGLACGAIHIVAIVASSSLALIVSMSHAVGGGNRVTSNDPIYQTGADVGLTRVPMVTGTAGKFADKSLICGTVCTISGRTIWAKASVGLTRGP